MPNLSRAVLITNHQQRGIRAQIYRVEPNLSAVALQLGLILGRALRPRDLRWIIHGNILYVSATDPARPPFHYTGCQLHELHFDGPTLAFLCPVELQEANRNQLVRDGSWAHITVDFIAPDADLVQTLFRDGPGTLHLDQTTKPLRSITDFGARGPEGRGEKSAPKPRHDPLTDDDPDEESLISALFESMNKAGFDVKLVEHDGQVIGLMATDTGEPSEPKLPEVILAEDPGYQHKMVLPNNQRVKAGIISDVAFDPVHFPTFNAFVLSLASGYCRMLHLNVSQGTIEPEVGKQLLTDLEEFIRLVNAQRKAEPALNWLETPFLADLPGESDS